MQQLFYNDSPLTNVLTYFARLEAYYTIFVYITISKTIYEEKTF